jgi:DNA repair exonuclease SbcCD ATPase subunit
VKPELVIEIRNRAESDRKAVQQELDSEDPPGLRLELASIGAGIDVVQEQLSKPERDRQAFTEALTQWEERLKSLRGTPEDSESLEGIKAELATLENVPAEIVALEAKQFDITKSIHAKKLAEGDMYRTLYGPVQDFVASHATGEGAVDLQFSVELVEEHFITGFLNYINQGKAGSFYGVDDGRIMVRTLIGSVDWAQWDQVEQFLRDMLDRLHNDRRPDQDKSTQVKDQIRKEKSVEELYSWLFGLSFVRARYQLQWDGKDVAQLSPGERGTLLLVFYLIVDDSDLPLIIDQPEANLDNLTVANKLVDCIRLARERRQVIIVTHNPNLAVVCDADQVIHAKMAKEDGNRITYGTGALEHPIMNQFTLDVLEGGRDPFDMRDDTYNVISSKDGA